MTVESLDILLTILDGARQGFTDDETKQGVDYIAMTAASRYATADAIADEAATLAFEGLTTEFTTATLRDLADVDPERLVDAYGRFADGSWTVDRRRRRCGARRRHQSPGPSGGAGRHRRHGVSPVAEVVVDTPIGPLLLVASEGALTHVWFDGLGRASTDEADLPT